jgi:WD40 repeat protein
MRYDGWTVKNFSIVLLCLLGFALAQPGYLLLDHHQKGVNSVAFSPDGGTLVTGSDDSTARVWGASSGEVLLKLTGHAGWVLGVSINGAGLVATADSEGRVAIWDTASRKLLRVFQAHRAWIRAVAFSDDGNKLVTGSDDKSVKIWEVSSGKLLRTLNGHTSWITGVLLVNNQVVTSSRDGTVQFWNAVSGNNSRKLELGQWIYNLALSPDGARFATAAQDGVKIWNRISGRLLQTVSERISWSVAFSPNGAQLSVGNDDGTVDIFDAKGTQKLETLTAHTSYIKALTYSPDSKKLATASRDGMARIWTLEGQ